MRLLHRFISHWAAAPAASTTPMRRMSRNSPAKSTCPGPRIRSTASPVYTGMSRVLATDTAASSTESPTKGR